MTYVNNLCNANLWQSVNSAKPVKSLTVEQCARLQQLGKALETSQKTGHPTQLSFPAKCEMDALTTLYYLYGNPEYVKNGKDLVSQHNYTIK